MKKKLHSYFIFCALVLSLFAGKAFAQTPATATWALSADQTSAVVGNVTAVNQNLADVTAASYASYTPTTGTYANTGAYLCQKLKPTAGWPGLESAELSTRYVEYNVSPVTGNTLTVNSISFDFGDSGSSNSMFANIYYSTDGFVTKTLLNTTARVAIPKYATTAEITNISYSSLGLNVTSGSTFSVRVYPWFTAAASTSKYLVERNVVITGTTSTAGNLPLDFLSLAGKADALGKTVGLNWSTTNEVNTKNFEIQKRTDADSFVTIGSIACKNTAGLHTYSFTDQNASAGTAYYRVLQFDNDGSSKSSSVIAVTTKAATTLSVYPNPAEQTLNVNHPLCSNHANFRVLSLDGKIMLKKAVAANSTSSILDVSSLASGAYMVILDDQNQKSSIKFIKK